jgi:hypothetical protein
MNRRSRLTILIAAIWLILPAEAHAQYLDPGASSVVVQLVIAGIIGFAAVLKLYWHRLKALFVSPRSPSGGSQSDPRDK